MSKQLEVNVYGLIGKSEFEYTEITGFNSELDEQGNLKSFEFTFRPIQPIARVKAKIVEVEDLTKKEE